MKRLQSMIPPSPWDRPRHKPAAGDRVILLHGLWRSSWSMEALAKALHARGFETLTIPYPSFREPLADIVEKVAADIPPSDKRTHFVTHSMGGIVLRCLAKAHPELVTARVVMLAPPNQGSAIVDWLEDFFPARLFFGPGGLALSSRNVRQNVPSLPDHCQACAIMGNRDRVHLFKPFFEGEHDGVVPVEGGRCGEHLQLEVVEAGHTTIMCLPEVIEKVSSFLEESSFS